MLSAIYEGACEYMLILWCKIERIDYLTNFKRIARSDAITRIPLVSLQMPGKEVPLFPLAIDDVSDFKKTPLWDLYAPSDSETELDPLELSEIASGFMGPGPWKIQKELKLPKSCDVLHFTNKNKKSNIIVTHLLKIIFRVQRGDDEDLDLGSGKRKLYDIVVQTPVHILSVSNPSAQNERRRVLSRMVLCSAYAVRIILPSRHIQASKFSLRLHVDANVDAEHDEEYPPLPTHLPSQEHPSTRITSIPNHLLPHHLQLRFPQYLLQVAMHCCIHRDYNTIIRICQLRRQIRRVMGIWGMGIIHMIRRVCSMRG